MKCEIKMLNRTFDSFINDIKTHPLTILRLSATSFLISLPIVILNEVFTGDSDYICILALVVLVIYVYHLLNLKCRNKKEIENETIHTK